MFDHLFSAQIRIIFIRGIRNICPQAIRMLVQRMEPIQEGLKIFKDFYIYFVSIVVKNFLNLI